MAQLGHQIPCAENGDECKCYVNSVELTNVQDSQVEDGGFLWCLHASPDMGQEHASPDMGREIEILSVASPSLTSVEEDAGPAMPSLAAPQGLIGYSAREHKTRAAKCMRSDLPCVITLWG